MFILTEATDLLVVRDVRFDSHGVFTKMSSNELWIVTLFS